MIKQINLRGCRTVPLLFYLKALGVLRLVAEQADPDATGHWLSDETFVLSSTLGEDDLIAFFAEQYVPTPIVVPWSGNDFATKKRVKRDGVEVIEEKEPNKSILVILKSSTKRLEPYRRTINAVFEIMANLGIEEKSQIEKKKVDFIAALRSRLPDEVVPWIDAAIALDAESCTFNFLLGGGGGNEGNFHFSDNFMQNLWECLLVQRNDTRKAGSVNKMDSRAVLNASLMAERPYKIKSKRSGTLLNPAVGKGPDQSHGLAGAPLNQWDFVLGLEGALCFAGGVVRRHNSNRSAPAFPFVTEMTAAGYETAVPGERAAGQREIWLPVWEKPMKLSELKYFFGEGRAEIKGKKAVNGAEFSRAVVSLGVDAGITAFARYGIMKGRMSRKDFRTAVPIGKFKVRTVSAADLLHDLDHHQWLHRFRVYCGKKNTPPRFFAALRRLDSAIMDFCQHGEKRRMLNILRALGRIEYNLVLSHETSPRSPVPRLSLEWLHECADDSPETRIAFAIASIGSPGKLPGSIQENIEPVTVIGERTGWAKEKRSAVWSQEDISRNLWRVLTRRMIEVRSQAKSQAENGTGLDACLSVCVSDVCRFIHGMVDDNLIAEILWGTMLVRKDRAWRLSFRPMPSLEKTLLPRSYALLKLLHLPGNDVLRNEQGEPVKTEPNVLNRLASGDIDGACALAARRLRSSGHIPMPAASSGGFARETRYGSSIDAKRLAGALIIPVMQVEYLKELAIRSI